MAKLPRDRSGGDVRAALEKIGFIFRRQRGSHMVLRRDPLPPASLSPIIAPFAWDLRQIVADAGLTIDEFLQLLN